MKKKLFTIFLLSLTLVLLLVGCGGTKIDLKDYASVTFSGVDGRGTAQIDVDYKSLADTMNKDKKSDEMISGVVDAVYLSTRIAYSFDKSAGLSNGDRVVATISIPESLMQTYNFKSATFELKVKVEGLKIPEKVNAFADVNVHISGCSPYATASVENNSDNEFLKRATYQIDKETNLRNGDTILVTITYTDDLIDQYGYIPEIETKEFEVSGLDSCIESYDDLSDSCRAEVYSDSKDRVDALIAGKSMIGKNFGGSTVPYQYDVDSENVKIMSEYLLVSKGPDFGSKFFDIYVVAYKTTGTIKPYQFFDTVYRGDIIVAVSYYNLTRDADRNNTVDLADAQYTYFKSEDDAYNYWITSNKDRYKTYEIKNSD